MADMSNSHSHYDPDSLRRELQSHSSTAKRWVVGYSGGLDSTALLAALQAANLPQPIVAIHIHHGLSANADQWAAHCRGQCAAWNIDCRVIKVSVQNRGYGVEDAAREARYQAYSEQLKAGDVLLLGHHEDDQAETLLFRLLRGTGPRGLGGILRERAFGVATILRPLLSFTRTQLEEYVLGRGLDWVTDESNTDDVYDRNYLRQQVIPLLEQRWPGYTARWRHTAEACQAADQLNGDLARIDLARCGERKERWGWSIELTSCQELADYRQDNLLRHWALQHQLAPIDRAALAEIRRQFLRSVNPPSSACVAWAGTELRFYRGRLYLSRELPAFAASGAVRVEQSLSLPGSGFLTIKTQESGGLRPGSAIEVGWRQGGERCHPIGRRHSQTLKKLLQEYQLEPWLRDRVPLIHVDGELAAVADLWICTGFQSRPGEPGLRLEWRLDS